MIISVPQKSVDSSFIYLIYQQNFWGDFELSPSFQDFLAGIDISILAVEPLAGMG